MILVASIGLRYSPNTFAKDITMALLDGLTRKNPPQMAKGDPKPATSYPSLNKDVTRSSTASNQKPLGPRSA